MYKVSRKNFHPMKGICKFYSKETHRRWTKIKENKKKKTRHDMVSNEDSLISCRIIDAKKDNDSKEDKL